jgi:Plasmid maintenance system antidote protein
MQKTKEQPQAETIELIFTGPLAMREKAIEAMRSFGFEEADTAPIPWRELEYFKDIHPGTYLSGARYREGLTQVELAKRTGVPRRHISEMENGKRPIGKQNAKKLAEALNIEPRRLLSV